MRAPAVGQRDRQRDGRRDLDVAAMLGRGAVPDRRQAGGRRPSSVSRSPSRHDRKHTRCRCRDDRAEQPGRQRAVEPQARDHLVVAAASAPSSVAPSVDRAREHVAQQGHVRTRTSPRSLVLAQGGLGLVVRVVVVAHRQQDAHRPLQRALEEARAGSAIVSVVLGRRGASVVAAGGLRPSGARRPRPRRPAPAAHRSVARVGQLDDRRAASASDRPSATARRSRAAAGITAQAASSSWRASGGPFARRAPRVQPSPSGWPPAFAQREHDRRRPERSPVTASRATYESASRSRAHSSVSRNMYWSCSRGETSPGRGAAARRSSAPRCRAPGTRPRPGRPRTPRGRGARASATNDATVTPAGARAPPPAARRPAGRVHQLGRDRGSSPRRSGGRDVSRSAPAPRSTRRSAASSSSASAEDRLGDRPRAAAPRTRRTAPRRRAAVRAKAISSRGEDPQRARAPARRRRQLGRQVPPRRRASKGRSLAAARARTGTRPAPAAAAPGPS